MRWYLGSRSFNPTTTTRSPLGLDGHCLISIPPHPPSHEQSSSIFFLSRVTYRQRRGLIPRSSHQSIRY
jgi:hypothetical protein